MNPLPPCEEECEVRRMKKRLYGTRGELTSGGRLKGTRSDARMRVSAEDGKGDRRTQVEEKEHRLEAFATGEAQDKIVEHEKKDESFRVIDRRPFTAEGELRPEAVEQERAERRPGPAPVKESVTAKPSAEAVEAAKVPAAANAPKPSRHFQTLVGMVARYAEASLGAYADPQSGQPILDIEGARAIVDVLDDLREKTAGRLAAEDKQLLDDVLGNLKLACVEMEQAALPGGMAGPADAAAGRPMGARGRR